MNTYQITVVYPVYITVDALSEEEAEEKALEQADNWLLSSSIKPIIHEIHNLEEKFM